MGCDGRPASQPVARDVREKDTYVYWHCPAKFIPDSVYKFYDIYKYYKTFQGANPGNYFDQRQIFLDACTVYDNEMSMYQEKINKIRAPRKPSKRS